MNSILEYINFPSDLKNLSIKEKELLAEEIRKFIIENVSKKGGHLASNLGVVELTIALHSVFNMPEDKIIFDVGHQTYVHKILTGRKDKFNTLRDLDGISGFPKTSESEYDFFNTGHSSTSISVALGMAKARDIKNEKNHVIAFIGDGALTGGMALEALNDAGSSNTNLIVILNDNEMSISKNVGAISQLLSKIRTKNAYLKSDKYIKKIANKIPFIGKIIIKIARGIKQTIKNIFIPNMFFEDLGFKYLGPIDGNDIERLEDILYMVKELDGPVLVHVVTKKGKGYKYACENPNKYHSVSGFNINTGKIKKQNKDYSKVFGDKLVSLANKNKNVVAVTAAMCDGTGLSKFKEKFKDRFFDVGIAEQHALGLAAGLAKEGLIPVVPIYSSFYQRCYDQVIHDICLQNLHVIMCVDRAGIVGKDGETHQGIFDLSFLSIVPNLTIMAPKDFNELEEMLEFAVNLNSPVVIRYPKGSESSIKFKNKNKLNLGKLEYIQKGEDITIISYGKMVSRAKEVSDILEKSNISCEIINLRFLKPVDEKILLKSINKTKRVVTIEDGILKGGLSSIINDIIIKNNISDIKIKSFGYDDIFIKQGEIQEIEKLYGLDKEKIASDIINEMNILK